MTDVARQLAADLLEVPEEVAKLTGRALEAMDNALEELGQRIDALETEIRGK